MKWNGLDDDDDGDGVRKEDQERVKKRNQTHFGSMFGWRTKHSSIVCQQNKAEQHREKNQNGQKKQI